MHQDRPAIDFFRPEAETLTANTATERDHANAASEMYGSIEDPAGADTVPSDARGAPSWAKKLAVALACLLGLRSRRRHSHVYRVRGG